MICSESEGPATNSMISVDEQARVAVAAAGRASAHGAPLWRASNLRIRKRNALDSVRSHLQPLGEPPEHPKAKEDTAMAFSRPYSVLHAKDGDCRRADTQVAYDHSSPPKTPARVSFQEPHRVQ